MWRGNTSWPIPCRANVSCQRNCSFSRGLRAFCAPEEVYGQTGKSNAKANERAARIAPERAHDHEPFRGDEKQRGPRMAGNAVVDSRRRRRGFAVAVTKQEEADAGQA